MAEEDSPAQAEDAQVEVVNDAARRFYEVRYGGESAGLLVYEEVAGQHVLTHTTIRQEYRGRGLAKVLIRRVLDDLEAKGARISIRCPIVDRFIEDNPQYKRLIDSADRHNGGH
nr:GNAT family N-acetyltransferase [Streptomyces sp. SID4948]